MEVLNAVPVIELPRWKCHKEVQAFKITGINIPPNQSGHVKLSGDGIEIEVTAEYMKKNRPQVGGFYVLYNDGYHSFSPAAAFESGYIGAHVVFYGPHACSGCGEMICKMGREYGSEVYTYPDKPVYPNTEWHPHVCDPKRVASTPKAFEPPQHPPDAVRMYSDNEVRRLLKKAQERGINLDEGSPVDKLTITELDEILK